MNTMDVEKIGATMEIMEQYEVMLADFYRKCMELWEQEREFWNGIALQELHHAENIKRMRGIIFQRPERFEINRPLNPVAVRTVMAGLQETYKRMSSGEITYERILIYSRDMENSILEAHYAQIVKTGDVEYQSLMKEIMTETFDHRKAIQQKLAEYTARR